MIDNPKPYKRLMELVNRGWKLVENGLSYEEGKEEMVRVIMNGIRKRV